MPAVLQLFVEHMCVPHALLQNCWTRLCLGLVEGLTACVLCCCDGVPLGECCVRLTKKESMCGLTGCMLLYLDFC